MGRSVSQKGATVHCFARRVCGWKPLHCWGSILDVKFCSRPLNICCNVSSITFLCCVGTWLVVFLPFSPGHAVNTRFEYPLHLWINSVVSADESTATKLWTLLASFLKLILFNFVVLKFLRVCSMLLRQSMAICSGLSSDGGALFVLCSLWSV